MFRGVVQFRHINRKKVREYAFDIPIVTAYTMGKTTSQQDERYDG